MFSVQKLPPATPFISKGNGAGVLPTEAPAKQVKLPIHSIPLLFERQNPPIKVIKPNESDYKHDIIPHWISDELKAKPPRAVPSLFHAPVRSVNGSIHLIEKKSNYLNLLQPKVEA